MFFNVFSGIAFGVALLGLYLWVFTYHGENSLIAAGKITFFIALIIGFIFAIL